MKLQPGKQTMQCMLCSVIVKQLKVDNIKKTSEKVSPQL